MTTTMCACGTELATANGREGPRCYLRRLRSIRVDKSGFDTAERDATYYDREPIREVFGSDAREQMLEETGGLGYAKDTPDGLMHRHHRTGEVERVDEDLLDEFYLGGDTEHEPD